MNLLRRIGCLRSRVIRVVFAWAGVALGAAGAPVYGATDVLSVLSGDNWRLSSAAAVNPPLRDGAPKSGDVVFSTRFKRDDSIAKMMEFEATRCEWVYTTDPEFIRQIKATGVRFGAAINANPKLPNDRDYAQDFDGKPLIAPWMAHWGAKWATSTNEVMRESQLSSVRQLIDLGAAAIHFDDAALQAGAEGFGGDFSAKTVQGFGTYLAKHASLEQLASWGIADLASFDYRKYLTERFGVKSRKEYLDKRKSLPTTAIWNRYLRSSVRPYFAELRRLLDSYGGKRTALSMNIPDPIPSAERLFLADFADYFISETSEVNAGQASLFAATVRGVGAGYVPSLIPRHVQETRRLIALFYSLGAPALVPWDVYLPDVGGTAQNRYFGRVEDFGDLYKFVRTNSAILNPLDAAPVVVLAVPIERYRPRETAALAARLTRGRIPFAIAMSGGEEYRYALNAGRLAAARSVIRVNPITDFPTSDQKVLAALKSPSIDSESVTEDVLSALAPVSVTKSTRPVTVVPKLSRENKSKLIVYIVMDEFERGATTNVELQLTRASMLGRNITSVALHTLDTATQTLSAEKNDRGARITVPLVREWGFLEIDFATLSP